MSGPAFDLIESDIKSMYETVFDITTAGYKSWTFPAFGLIFIAAGIALVLKRNSFPGWWWGRPRACSIFSGFFLGFAVLWTAGSFIATYREYSSLLSALASGAAEVAEGVVTDFKPMPASGHAMERFCVQGACFEYSDFIITAGFNNTSAYGGPIRAGLPVRVTHVRTAIVKLEIRK